MPRIAFLFEEHLNLRVARVLLGVPLRHREDFEPKRFIRRKARDP